MQFDDYQEQTRRHASYPEADKGTLKGVVYTTLGLAGEAGEIPNKVKKIIRDNDGVITPEVREAICKEIGDVLWYTARLADELRMPLDLIAQNNLIKLDDRKARNVIAGSGDDR